MNAITPQSPVAAVFGRQIKKRARVVDGLGLETIGDLLHHFPRRYVDLTQLSEIERLAPGQTITVVGEVASVKSAQFMRNGRRQFRTTLLIRTGGPDFWATFFLPYAPMVEKYESDF